MSNSELFALIERGFAEMKSSVHNDVHEECGHTRKMFLEVLRPIRDYIKLELEENGGCDHSVGICACSIYSLLEDIERELNPSEEHFCEECGEKKDFKLFDNSLICSNCKAICHSCGETYDKIDMDFNSDECCYYCHKCFEINFDRIKSQSL